MSLSQKILLLVTAVFALALRFVPMPLYNVAAISAFGILCGTMVRPVWVCVLMCLAVRLVTDTILQVQTGFGFYDSIGFDYLAYALITGLAYSFRSGGLIRDIILALSASALFFLISNFGVWCMPHGGSDLYPMTLSGLKTCYVSALPFLRGTIVGDLLFTVAFLSAFRFVTVQSTAVAAVPETK